MKLAEIFSALAYGELSQQALGVNIEGELTESNYPTLVSHINLGLSSLYKRFNLKEGRVNIPLLPEESLYSMGVDDIHKIERILTKEGTEIGLNDDSDPYSCYTPTMGTLRVNQYLLDKPADMPDKYKTDELVVIYRANHPKLTLVGGFINPDKTDVELPYSYLEALLYFVASRVHNPIGMANEFHAGNSWAAKYEAECQRLEMLNIEVDHSTRSTRFERTGWV
jgi:hypothetical protein